MRPIALEMEGFLAYRKRAEVDFTDAELFVLEGATGSGKSSVIDAMVFALYGTIPRLGNKSAVAPVINAAMDVARVRFEFAIDDATYQVVRRVERTKSGAQVTEARLQEGEKTLESGSKEVTSAVSELLGLGFEHFTKAVVLPQGLFAEFLTDTPKERQDLLRALLDLGLFEQIKMRANERATAAKGSVRALEETLAKLEIPSSEDLDAARQRVSLLESAQIEMKQRLDELDVKAADLEKAEQELVKTIARMEQLEATAPPGNLGELASAALESQQRVDATQDQLNALDLLRGSLTARAQELAAKPDLSNWSERHAELTRLARARDRLRIDDLRTELETLENAEEELVRSYDSARSAHAAHDLRQALEAGQTCPVCLQVVGEVPNGSESPTDDIRTLRSSLEAARSRAKEARDRLAEVLGRESQIVEQIADTREHLAGAPDLDTIVTGLEQWERIEAESEEMAKERARLQAAYDEAREAHSGSRKAIEDLSVLLYEARARVQDAGPPPLVDDPVANWSAFDEWRLGELGKLGTAVADAERAVVPLRESLAVATEGFSDWLADLGVAGAGSPMTDLALAAERQRSDLASMVQAIDLAAITETQIKTETARAGVASELGRHLKSNNFEAWVMREALDALVLGANRLLDELSAGAYSLRAEKTGFAVVDHFNADLERTTRSLSGGELFLVSLALALSMASQLADLTGSSSRLESVFLDEGFGSLDRESLDTVAAVLDDLVVQGRTVGIVTHVKELAERMPVRFEVVKGPDSATIARRPA